MSNCAYGFPSVPNYEHDFCSNTCSPVDVTKCFKMIFFFNVLKAVGFITGLHIRHHNLYFHNWASPLPLFFFTQREKKGYQTVEMPFFIIKISSILQHIKDKAFNKIFLLPEKKYKSKDIMILSHSETVCTSPIKWHKGWLFSSRTILCGSYASVLLRRWFLGVTNTVIDLRTVGLHVGKIQLCFVLVARQLK